MKAYILEHELKRRLKLDPLHVCHRAAVTAVPLKDKILMEQKKTQNILLYKC